MQRAGVVSLAVSGIAKRLRPKAHWVFSIEVEWSDRNRATVYRSHEQFFEWHCGLLFDFPEEAGQRGRPRTIPFLPGKKLFRRAKSQSLAMERAVLMDMYLKSLVKCPEKVLLSDQVTDFFTSSETDSFPPQDEIQQVIYLDLGSAGTGMFGNKPTIVERSTVGGVREEALADSSTSTAMYAVDIPAHAPAPVPVPNADTQLIAIEDYTGATDAEVSFRAGDVGSRLAFGDNGWLLVEINGATGWASESFFQQA